MAEFFQSWNDVCPKCERISAYKCKDLSSVLGASKRIILQCGHCQQQFKSTAPCPASYSRDSVYLCRGMKVVYKGWDD